MRENYIYCEDNMTTIDRMEDDYLDLTITSPPYNVNLGNNTYNKSAYDLYNDNLEHRDYIDWLGQLFHRIYQKTKPGGRCVINVGDGRNGRVPTHVDIFNVMRESKWIPMANIIWMRNNAGNRTSWGSFKSPSSPSFVQPYEFIMVFAKESLKLQCKGETDLTKEEFIPWTWAFWNIGTESAKRIGHPAPFPVELPLRCIKMLTWRDAVVYDPFMGSGTTAVACKMTGRRFIGSEISPDYCGIAYNRLNKMEREGGNDTKIEVG
jgi:site-specific DNA-methyltransferase (adenine-specific)